MPIEDKRCFVQFIHPGGEHRPDANGNMGWNKDDHKRKFVEINGQCRQGGYVFDGPLHFWTEWEPQSNATTIAQPLEHGPSFIHHPFYVTPTSYHKLQNTDPFVFGDFFYTGCQQNTCRGPTQLRFLEQGSVILFGSCVKNEYVLDTVFVVDRWEKHDARNYQQLKAQVPHVFWDVTMRAWYQDVSHATSCAKPDTKSCGPAECRLYWGATFDKPVDGMFSFFPCMPAAESPSGFARPAITILGATTNGLLQGKKLNAGTSRQMVIEYWNDMRKQVESQGLWLGLHADAPKRRNRI